MAAPNKHSHCSDKQQFQIKQIRNFGADFCRTRFNTPNKNKNQIY